MSWKIICCPGNQAVFDPDKLSYFELELVESCVKCPPWTNPGAGLGIFYHRYMILSLDINSNIREHMLGERGPPDAVVAARVATQPVPCGQTCLVAVERCSRFVAHQRLACES